MKPHEETWEWDAEAGEIVQPNTAEPTEAVAVDFSDEEYGTLGAAAPEMARALLHGGHWRGGMWHVQGCDGYNVPSNCPERCGIARAALAKAGVL